jgi:4-diphosphocytidyl-2-C-methyl-D-erythritol kinase
LTPASDSVVETAPAKLNLYLHVVGRRADGYHLLDSLIAFAECGDVLRAAPASALSLSLQGPFADALSGESDNLVLKAARRLAAEIAVSPSAALVLTKNLPVASGIGGGSADAAAALRALCRLWRVQVDASTLAGIAAGLGADVPVCLHGAPTYMQGIGEVLVPAPKLPQPGLVLINPRIPLPTPKVFAARRGAFSEPAPFAEPPRDPAALATALAARRNDLEAAAIEIVPAVADVLAALKASPECLLARMSGSGATCFGIYDNAVAAETAARWLLERQKSWWIKATCLTVT